MCADTRTKKAAAPGLDPIERHADIIAEYVLTGSISETARRCKCSNSTIYSAIRKHADIVEAMRAEAMACLPAVMSTALATLFARLVDRSDQAPFEALTVAIVRLSEVPGRIAQATLPGSGLGAIAAQDGGGAGETELAGLFGRLVREEVERMVRAAADARPSDDLGMEGAVPNRPC